MFNSFVSIRLKQKISSIFTGDRQGSLKNFLFKSIAGTFGLSIVNAGLNYIITILLARFLGATGYGTYVYALTLVGILQLPALLGLTTLLTREISAYKTKESWSLATGLFRWSDRVTFIFSLVLSLLAIYFAWLYKLSLPEGSFLVISIAILSLPLVVLSSIRQAVMQGLGYIVKAQVPTVLVRPVLLVIFLPVAFFWLGSLSAVWAMAIYVLTTAVAAIMLVISCDRSLPSKLKSAIPQYQGRLWIKDALPMLFISGMYLVNHQTDTVMLGALSDASSVGIYSIACRGVMVTGFVLSAFNTSLAPVFTNLYTGGEMDRLQRLVTKSCRSILLATTPIVLGLILFGNWFMLMFGAEFVAGTTALSILCLGQLFNAFTGSVALLLIMTGYQQYTAIGVAISAILNIILNWMLIPLWGINGAAIATTSSGAVWNIILVFFVYQKLKIFATPIGKIGLIK